MFSSPVITRSEERGQAVNLNDVPTWQPLAEVSTGGTLDRGGRPSMAHSTGNRTQDSEIPALCADTTQRASSHWADTVLCAASFYPPVSMRHSIAYLGL